MVVSSSMNLPLFIQYNNEDIIDGVGAQALRILGIFGIARQFRLNYIHQPILQLGLKEELTGPKFSEDHYQELLDQVNKLFDLPSDKIPKHFSCIAINSRNVGRKVLLGSLLLSFLLLPLRVRVVLKITLPFGITNYLEDPFRTAATYVHNNIPDEKRLNRPENVLHYRTVIHSKDDNRNFLNSEYYTTTLLEFLSKPHQSISSLVIHCDIYPQTLSDSLHNSRVMDFSLFCQNFQYLGIEVKPYAPFFETLFDMVFARNFFMSRSALSYLAGVLNYGTVIYPPGHGHPRLPRWKVGCEKLNSVVTMPNET